MEWTTGKVFVFLLPPPHPVVIAVESPLAGALESKRKASTVIEAGGGLGARGTGWTGALGPSQDAAGRPGLVVMFILWN